MVKEASDGERANSASSRSDGGKICAGVDIWLKVAFDNAVFAGCASIDKSGAGGDNSTRNQPRNARGAYYYIKVLKVCQVIAAVEKCYVVI